MILARRRFRLTAKILGRKPVRFKPASILARVLPRTDSGSAKYLETVGRERPIVAANSSMVAIFFGGTGAVPFSKTLNTYTSALPLGECQWKTVSSQVRGGSISSARVVSTSNRG